MRALFEPRRPSDSAPRHMVGLCDLYCEPGIIASGMPKPIIFVLNRVDAVRPYVDRGACTETQPVALAVLTLGDLKK
jgi:hypothetical protein